MFSHHTTGLISPTKVLPQSGFGKIRGKIQGHIFSHDMFVDVDLTAVGCRIDPSVAKLFGKTLFAFDLIYG
ncbi:MAG: hypothetical protein Q8O99_03985 [bacterium]|nr:hypothetical protein [bacterium]